MALNKNKQPSLLWRTLQSFLDNLLSSSPEATLWVAYSGGVDSHVLLHCLVTLKRELNLNFLLKVLHVNHGLSPNANDWQQHCERECQRLGIDFYAQQLVITCKPKEGVEAKARKARYAYFADIISDGNSLLLTAHHQQDQAETLLIQLLRGAGPKGLAAMPAKMAFSKGFLLRPLLDIAKQEILAYANAHQLTWVEDESNQEHAFTRNYLRHAVMPILASRWSSVAATLSRSARLCAESMALLDEYAEVFLKKCSTPCSSYLLINELKKLEFKQQKLVLRYYLTQHDFALPSEVKLKTIIHNILYAGIDRHPVVTWADVRASRSCRRDFLIFEKIYPRSI